MRYVLAIFVIVLSGCVGESPVGADLEAELRLPGEWWGRSAERPHCYKRWILVRSHDGDFEEGCGQSDTVAFVSSGTWSVSNGQLRLKYHQNDQPQERHFTLQVLEYDKLVVVDQSGGSTWHFGKTAF